VVRNSLGIFSEEQYLRPSEAEDRDDEQEAEAEDRKQKALKLKLTMLTPKAKRRSPTKMTTKCSHCYS